ncbi:MAG: choice-of-anchor D domain-containing protein [Candidatus Acidiferrales bacterium]
MSVLTFGAPNLDFTPVSAGTTCPNVISGTCAVELQFQPTKPGRRQGVVLVTDPSGKTLLSVSLDGAGTGPVVGFAPSTISTLVGGSAGAGAAGGAQLMRPMGVAIDGFGNYYVADQKANKVWRVTSTGAISAFAGTGVAGFSGDGGSATSAQLNGPTDVIVDGGGFVYISDTNNNVVRMVDTKGVISTYAGQYYAPGTTPPAVCSTATNSVGDGCPANQMTLNTPLGLVFCHAQNLHIADKLDNRVRTIDRITNNTFTQVGSGVQGYNGDGELNTSAELNGPTGLDMDAANYIYVADSGNHIIRKTLLTGTTPNPISTIAGTPGATGNLGDSGAAMSAQLNSPFGVRVDAAGDVYIADPASNVIRKVNVATGVISTIAGTASAGYSGDAGDATKAQLNGPSDFAIDESGNLYIADSQNGAVRKIDVSDAPSLSFAATMVGSTSASQNVSVMNLGNAPLNVSQITTPASYSLGGPNTSCNLSSGEGLNYAESCTLGVEFAPTTAGTINGTVVLADNATPASQTIALSGTAVSATAAAYTLSTKTPTISISAGANGTATLVLNSNGYAGTVSFTTSVASSDGTPADLTATATAVTLTPGGSGTSTVTIAANQSASNRTPSTPWDGTTTVFCAFLIGLPFIFRRKRGLALLLFALAIPLAGSLVACTGASDPPNAPSNHATRTYVVTAAPKATAAGSMTVTNPAPATITVTVQ